jgi:RIO kinase 1
MRLPEAFEPLVNHGILDEVVRPLMSGKEALVYLVISEGRECVAKVYKDAKERSFKNKAEYTEGRRVRNSRDQRAMSKRTAYGRSRDEAAWKSTEVDMIYRLSAAGVRVPEPYWFVEGVLLMELVCDADGSPARRLGELQFTPDDATLIFEVLLADVVRMLHAGVVHGDLSEFNVLMASDGPVIIDFPQAIDAAGNQNARKLLIRDVDNLHRFVARFVRGWTSPPYAEELWSIYERGELKADTRLTGKYVRSAKQAHVDGVMDVIDDARRDEQLRRRNQGGHMQQGPRGKRPPQAVPPRHDGRNGRGPQQQTTRQPERRPGQQQQASGGSERRPGPSQQNPRRPHPPQWDARGGPPRRSR